jgi:nitrous oxidase accessory protein NosD
VRIISTRKLLLLLFSILFAIGLILTLVVVYYTSQSKIIQVKRDFETIQEAINNANAGDTIYVSAGIYYEHIIINKTVSLIGENNNSTIIDGSNDGTIVEIVEADDVSISGFKLQNSGYGWIRHGIYVYKAHNCRTTTFSESVTISN